MNNQTLEVSPLSWGELEKLRQEELNRINGPTNSYSCLRLFGNEEDAVRVTLYRDHHAWCPYCQKVWLWLEWKQIPYRIKKVTMRCYGQKEDWYLRKVPSGILPALEIDNRLITESDQILFELEKEFGPLGRPLNHPETTKLRNLERELFRAWCLWLCRPGLNNKNELKAKELFQRIAYVMEKALSHEKGPWLDKTINTDGRLIPGTSDVIFIPYLERMNASLLYYKGFSLREEHPAIDTWFIELETSEEYRGTQGDFHTHAHDLPPQMGGCWSDPNKNQKYFSNLIDSGEGVGKLETSFSFNPSQEFPNPKAVALERVIKHREPLLALNPLGIEHFDQPLRAALTRLILSKPSIPNKGSATGLRYLKDRISVPRDMPLLAARELRIALEQTAQIDSQKQSSMIPKRNRFDQNPLPFQTRSM